MKAALSQLGNPQNDFPSVHIAGTNGKGSVGALLHSVLDQSGMRVGFYSSPHLARFNERFMINLREISSEELSRLTIFLRESLTGPTSCVRHLTQFEFLTALALLWFSRRHVDVAIIETGLGGRLDATNALERVLLSVITSIGIDHTPWLGTSLTSIAFEKAGIIRNRVPVVTGARGKALTVIKKVAEQKNSPLVCASERALWGGDGITLRCGLRGRHQVENARVAYRALETLDHPRLALTRRLIQQGFSKVHWPGRYEKFSLRKGGRSQWIILDGAHNPQAITALVQTLKEDRFSRVSLLFGALKDKDSKTMVRILFPLVHQGFIVPLPSDRSEDPCRIIPFWKGHKHVFPAPSIGAGWKKILAGPDRNPVVVTGSLYLVGAIRKKLTVRGRS